MHRTPKQTGTASDYGGATSEAFVPGILPPVLIVENSWASGSVLQVVPEPGGRESCQRSGSCNPGAQGLRREAYFNEK